MKQIRERQMKFLGHVMRKEKLENLCLTGRIPGRRARGRQREKYMDGIVRATGARHTAASLLQRTRDRREWQTVIANALSGPALQ